MKQKIQVLAMQYKYDNIEEIVAKLGVTFDGKGNYEGKPTVTIPGHPLPLKEGDWIVKAYKGYDVFSDEYFNENFTTYDGLVSEIDREKQAKSLERLMKVIKSVSKMPYSKDRDYVLHNLQKSFDALEGIN